jgi:hypothetical protein
MASSFNAAGEEDLRSYIQSNWTYVALIDDTGSEITRIDIINDSRASWSSGSASNPLTATITVTGGDSDIDVANNGATTFSSSESYKTSTSNTTLAADSFTNVTLQIPGDQLTIEHNLEIPPI